MQFNKHFLKIQPLNRLTQFILASSLVTGAPFIIGTAFAAVNSPLNPNLTLNQNETVQSPLLANVTWTGNAGDGLWGTAGNWSSNTSPAGNDTITVTGATITDNNFLIINGSGSIILEDSSLNLNANPLLIQNLGQLNMTNSNLGLNNVINVGTNPGYDSKINMALNSTLTATQVTAAGDAGSKATITLDNSNFNLSDILVLGENGTGILSIANNSTLNTVYTLLAYNNGNVTATIGSNNLNDHSQWTLNYGMEIATKGTGIVTINQGSTVTIQNGSVNLGAAGGNGTLEINGGTLTTNAIFFNGTGSMTINSGTLKANNDSSSFISAISNPFTLNNNLTIDNQGYSIGTSYNNAFTGSGSLTLTGSGVFSINGTNSYTGATAVKAGTLRVYGDITSSSGVIIDSGATLTGSGTVSTTTVAGSIAPGDSIGTIMVQGNYVQQAGSVYQVEMNADNNDPNKNDLINIAGAATIDAGSKLTLAVNGSQASYTVGSKYKILTTTDGVNGQTIHPYTITNPELNSLLFTSIYGDESNGLYKSIYLTMVHSPTIFNSANSTPNQTAVSNALMSDTNNPIYSAIVLDPASNSAIVQKALDNLSGEGHVSMTSAFTNDNNYIRDIVLNHLSSVDETSSYWLHGYGNWNNNKGNSSTSKMKDHNAGLLAGAENTTSTGVRLGIFGGYSHSKVEIDNLFSQIKSDNYHLGLYGTKTIEHLRLSLGGMYSWYAIDSSRIVNVLSINEQLSADYHGHSAQGFAEAGYALMPAGHAMLEPFAQIAYLDTHLGRFNEQSTTTGLIGYGSQQDITYSTLGSRFITKFNRNYHKHLTMNGRTTLGWRHAYNDLNPTSTFSFSNTSSPFNISGVPLAKDALVIDAGIVGSSTTKPWQLTLAYNGQFAKQINDNGIRGEFNWQFD